MDITDIIVGGKVYEAVPKGSRHCSDCDLFRQCQARWRDRMATYCHAFDGQRIIFRLRQTEQDKSNPERENKGK